MLFTLFLIYNVLHWTPNIYICNVIYSIHNLPYYSFHSWYVMLFISCLTSNVIIRLKPNIRCSSLHAKYAMLFILYQICNVMQLCNIKFIFSFLRCHVIHFTPYMQCCPFHTRYEILFTVHPICNIIHYAYAISFIPLTF